MKDMVRWRSASTVTDPPLENAKAAFYRYLVIPRFKVVLQLEIIVLWVAVPRKPKTYFIPIYFCVPQNVMDTLLFQIPDDFIKQEMSSTIC